MCKINIEKIKKMLQNHFQIIKYCVTMYAVNVNGSFSPDCNDREYSRLS